MKTKRKELETAELLKALEKPTVSVPVAGDAVYSLGRNASYTAVKNGKIPLVDPEGPKFRVPSNWVREKLGL